MALCPNMPPNLSRMPAEVLLGIFSLLKPADNDNLQLTCRRVNKVILENPGPLPVREIDLEFSLPSFDFTAVDHAVRRVEPLMLKFKHLAALMAGRVSVKSVTLAMDDGGMDRFAFSYLSSSLRKYRDQFKVPLFRFLILTNVPREPL